MAMEERCHGRPQLGSKPPGAPSRSRSCGSCQRAMADVAGAGKYHSFSGINTDKAVMDNLEAPCLGSDESTKMPNRCQTHLFNYQYIYI